MNNKIRNILDQIMVFQGKPSYYNRVHFYNKMYEVEGLSSDLIKFFKLPYREQYNISFNFVDEKIIALGQEESYHNGTWYTNISIPINFENVNLFEQFLLDILANIITSSMNKT